MSLKAIISTALAVLLSAQLSSVVLLYDFKIFYDGPAPDGPTPWVSAEFSDIDANTVQLSLTSNLIGNQYIGAWYFNFNNTLNVNNLNFDRVGGSVTNAPTVSLGQNSEEAGSGGLYDILLEFSNENSERFGAGDDIVLEISSVNPFDPYSFNFLSSPNGGNIYFSAAEVRQPISGGDDDDSGGGDDDDDSGGGDDDDSQSGDDDDSGGGDDDDGGPSYETVSYVAVPEPSTYLILTSLIVATMIIAYRRKRTSIKR